MKAIKLLTQGLALGLMMASVLNLPAAAEDLTAFKLVKEGNRYIGEQAKDRIVQIRSEKSIGSLTPSIWYVVYYDPTATLKAVEVKFGAGKMLSVKRPMRLLEPVTGGDEPLAQEKLKVDSDQALATALKEPLLANLKPTASELTLQKTPKDLWSQSGSGEAVWKVRLWSAKLRDPAKSVDIGLVWISAASGKAIRTDLHIDRVD